MRKQKSEKLMIYANDFPRTLYKEQKANVKQILGFSGFMFSYFLQLELLMFLPLAWLCGTNAAHRL